MTIGPKWSRGALIILNNTYVVRNGLLYEYYPYVPNKNRVGNFFGIEVSPSIKAPGIAIVERKSYNVSLRDLLRRKIDVRKIILSEKEKAKRPSERGGNHYSDAEVKINVQQHNHEQRFGRIIGDQVSKDADMAWENQVNSLLQTFHTEEGEDFETSNFTQPRPTDENSSIPDIFEDIGQD